MNTTLAINYIITKIGDKYKSLTDSLTSFKNEFKVTAENLSASLTKTLTTVDNKLQEMKADLEIRADEIESKLTETISNEIDTAVENTSLITLTAQEIKESISQNGDLLASLGISSDGIAMVGKNLSYSTSDGEEVLFCNESGLKLTGEINATSGKIGGWTITENGLLKLIDKANISIKSDTLYYLATDLEEVSINTEGWTTTALKVTYDKKYLWTYHKYTYVSGDTVNTEPVIIGMYGIEGTNVITYTWIKYADDANGTNLNDSPENKDYIGFAYNKTTLEESNNPEDYTWSLIKGTDGVPGAKGEDGVTLYTWIKYAPTNDLSLSDMTELPDDNTIYIGIAVNKDSAIESTDKTDYVWSKFKGDQGIPGTQGEKGRAIIKITKLYKVLVSTADTFAVPTTPSSGDTKQNDSSWKTTIDWSSIQSVITNNADEKNTKQYFKIYTTTETLFSISPLYEYSTVVEDEYTSKIGTKATYIGDDGIYAGTIAGDHVTALTIDASLITAGEIDAAKIKINNLEVGTNVTMGDKATISWSNVNNRPDKLSDFNNDLNIPSDLSLLTDTDNILEGIKSLIPDVSNFITALVLDGYYNSSTSLSTIIGEHSIETGMLAANVLVGENIVLGKFDDTDRTLDSYITFDSSTGKVTLGSDVVISWNSDWDSNVSKASGIYDDTNIKNRLTTLESAGYLTSSDLADYAKSSDLSNYAKSSVITDWLTGNPNLTTYVDATSIVTSTAIANSVYAGKINASNITTGTLDASKLTVSGLVVGTNVSMGSNATITWSLVSDGASQGFLTANNVKSTIEGYKYTTASDALTAAQNWLTSDSTGSTTIGKNFVYTGTVAANLIIVGGGNGSLSYSDLSDKPTIPTTVSELSDASSYALASTVTTLSNKFSNYYTSAQVDAKGFLTSSALSGYATTADLSGYSQVTSNADGTLSITTGDNTYTAYSSATADGKYMIYGTAKGTGTTTSGSKFLVSTDGLLTAYNAIIYGTVYATAGEFTGKVTASEGAIGSWNISSGALSSVSSGVGIVLNPTAISIKDASSNYVLLDTNTGFRTCTGGINILSNAIKLDGSGSLGYGNISWDTTGAGYIGGSSVLSWTEDGEVSIAGFTISGNNVTLTSTQNTDGTWSGLAGTFKMTQTSNDGLSSYISLTNSYTANCLTVSLTDARDSSNRQTYTTSIGNGLALFSSTNKHKISLNTNGYFATGAGTNIISWNLESGQFIINTDVSGSSITIPTVSTTSVSATSISATSGEIGQIASYSSTGSINNKLIWDNANSNDFFGMSDGDFEVVDSYQLKFVDETASSRTTLGTISIGAASIGGSSASLGVLNGSGGSTTSGSKGVTNGLIVYGANGIYLNSNSKGVLADTTIYTASDMRLKDIIEDIEIDLDTIVNAPIFKYTFKSDKDKNVKVGTSAQYWEEICPELVTYLNDTLTLDYQGLNTLSVISLARIVKEQELRIAELEAKLNA